MKFSGVCLTGLLMAGCVSNSAPEPDLAALPVCERVVYALNHPWSSLETKTVAMEVGRNNQCFGQAPPTRMVIDQNVRMVR